MEIYSESLAKLFATENISVEIKKITTAFFDVKNRRMAFPLWILDLPVASRELLMLHEASHALHTPEFGTHEKAKEYEQVFRTILNVLEDKRIEDLMKDKYPGAKATFIRGFFELVNKNFFGISFYENIEDFNLIDKMNLYFKGDYYFDCEFSEEEQYWVDRACNNSSFEEVYQNAEELYEYLKEKYSKEVLENVKYDLDDFSLNDSGEYVDGASKTMDELRELLSKEDFEKLEEALNDNDDQKAANIIKEKLEDDNLDFAENNSAKTDTNWEQSQQNFSSKKEDDTRFNGYRKEPINVSMPRLVNSNDYIINNALITKTINDDKIFLSDIKKSSYESFMKEHKDSMRPIMNHMLKEFYRKQAAEDFRRAKQSKTGNLNLNKLPHYKYNTDVFLNKTVINDQKNHGFVLLVDWSGSMNYIMTSAILQLINNVTFCKNIDVPFVAYAFSSEASKSDDIGHNVVFHGVEKGDLRISSQLKLLELFDSEKNNYEEQLKNLYYLAFCFLNNQFTSREHYHSFAEEYLDENKNLKINTKDTYRNYWIKHGYENMCVLSDIFNLGSTPLNDSLLLMNHVIPKQKQKMNVDIMNFIVITDGDSDHPQTPALQNDVNTIKILDTTTSDWGDANDKWVSNSDRSSDLGSSYKNGKIFIKSMYSNKIYSISSMYDEDLDRGIRISRCRTRTLAHILKQETDANVVSIELVNYNTNGLRRVLANSYGICDYDRTEEIVNDYKKNGFANINGTGYDSIFIVNTSVICDYNNDNSYLNANNLTEDKNYLDDLSVNKKGVITTKQLTNALGKNVSQKNKRRFLATRIVDIVSEKQKIST
tara:strand:+ start:27098 stop:29572 length:2475 start_codon:yes stop_codon:yes gene_type:complete